MTEPNFEDIARRIMQYGNGETDEKDVVDFRDIGWGAELDKSIALVRQVWNARGAADVKAAKDAENDRHGAPYPDLDRIVDDIKALDR